MPLEHSKKKASIGHNIGELQDANKTKPKGKKRSRAQIVAIALNTYRKAGGKYLRKE